MQSRSGKRSANRISNHIHSLPWDVSTYPCSHFDGGLSKPPLKLGNGWVIIFHSSIWMFIGACESRRNERNGPNLVWLSHSDAEYHMGVFSSCIIVPSTFQYPGSVPDMNMLPQESPYSLPPPNSMPPLPPPPPPPPPSDSMPPPPPRPPEAEYGHVGQYSQFSGGQPPLPPGHPLGILPGQQIYKAPSPPASSSGYSGSSNRAHQSSSGSHYSGGGQSTGGFPPPPPPLSPPAPPPPPSTSDYEEPPRYL